MPPLKGVRFRIASQEDVPVLRNAFRATMSRKPKSRRGRRDFSLDELLTEVDSGLADVPPLAEPSETPAKRDDGQRDDQRGRELQRAQTR
jgi:hypothetical protein